MLEKFKSRHSNDRLKIVEDSCHNLSDKSQDRANELLAVVPFMFFNARSLLDLMVSPEDLPLGCPFCKKLILCAWIEQNLESNNTGGRRACSVD